ncbi:putative phosphoenolpyruvate synthase [Reticulibacter mediterranei]|uniref:Rifampicin phosphotransferase n=1 Tax=Reticulibacter mediterranei TaxID=2778369 RepID=A0A8J3N746_9CHLR|nr:phosphoenolpyruvate synthase [Reticulibacter mediterranei]GHO98095.1 putative phosphoenolpyruvate synthase [Reticulibacter mediterranei]
MKSYVLGFQEIDTTKLAMVGGKGANLGELSRIDGIRVPEGFCVTTEAYKKIIGQIPEFHVLLEQLSLLKVEDRERIHEISGKIRGVIDETAIGKDIDEVVTSHLAQLGENHAYAVRSSATAEDLPMASFAGQQDTYLNILGKEAILKHISKCWASLFTERAVMYRMQNGFDHNKVYLSAVIQKMVFPEAAGILFTADPITSNRKVVSIDASFGLGEALVSGLVDADLYKVQEGKIVSKKISTKKLAIYALKEGGTKEQQIGSAQQNMQTLTDEQILQLEKTGRRIEAHFGRPQDIEWCLSEGQLYILQSRPITTLYPVPKVNDGKLHIYMSLGHQQMMTDAMKPLGLSFFPIWLSKLGASTVEAGDRMYMDVSYDLASPMARKIFVKSGLGSVDMLIQNALSNVLKRKDYIKSLPHGKTTLGLNGGTTGQMVSGLLQAMKIYRENDADLIQRMIAKNDALTQDVAQRIKGRSGDGLFDFILQDMDEAYKTIVLDNYGVGIVGVYAPSRLSKKMKQWLDEENVTNVLSQSLSNNVTTEMGLELLDVADVVRRYPAVLAYFRHADDATFFEALEKLDGGKAVGDAIQNYLSKYGVRCSGEIDITRARWAEKPTLLIPMILNNIKNFEPGSHQMIVEQKRLEVAQKIQELIGRIERLPGGKRKAKKTKKMISVFRNFVGFREYPKYAMMQRFYVYKQALKKEAALLVQKGVIQEPEDIYYLTFEELRKVASTYQLDYSLITKRKADYEIFEKLTPPRVMTSDGEIITGEYDTGEIPRGALMGVPVSSGVIEGRARIVLKLEEAVISEGDILVTAFTDPSWTSLFVSIKGLVTEVGGMMTHGAVVAREYGLPAVVSVENATRLIQDGQRIRVNGTKGYVEILEE